MLNYLSSNSSQKLKTSVFSLPMNEGTLKYSDDFGAILKIMSKDDRIRNYLMDLSFLNTEIPNLVYNYLEISRDENDKISFITDEKSREIAKTELYKVRTVPYVLNYLKYPNGEYIYKKIFDGLGFSPKSPPLENSSPPRVGQLGIVKSQFADTESGHTYVLFEFKSPDGNIETCCMFKNYLTKYTGDSHLYSKRSDYGKVGRLVNGILTKSGMEFTSSELEKFVNGYKAAWDIYHSAFSRFDIVRGYHIQKWYYRENYEDKNKSTVLNDSCMSYEECGEYFGIYCDNPDVCQLVILYSPKSVVFKDGKLTGTKIDGRALLWKLENGDMFMDRIYYNKDSDVELFKNFAIHNGWSYKKYQDSISKKFARIKNGTSLTYPISVKLKYASFDEYPFLDTLPYVQIKSDGSGLLSNDPDYLDSTDDVFELRETDGTYGLYYGY
jgi:hypothetical protein